MHLTHQLCVIVPQADAEKDVELAECTFHPAINQVSAKIIEAMGPHDEDMGEFYKRTVSGGGGG